MKFFLNKKIQPSFLKHHYNKQIEQYRGLCALLVFITHGTAQESLLFNNFRWPEFIHYLGAGYLSVLVFFCISGYVIAVSNDYGRLNIKAYFKKRLIRLYPAYLIAILLCAVIAKNSNVSIFAGNLFFLQNAFPYWHYKVPVFVNFATWSLNYEVLYYAIFIPLFFIRPKVWQLLSIMLLISITLLHVNNKMLFFINYLNGYYFWITGLFFGWEILKGNKKNNKVIPLLSLLLLQLCQNHLGIGAIMLHVFNIYPNTNLNWVFDIPFCVMVMATLTHTNNIFLKLNKIFCYTIPSIIFTYLILHNRILENERWMMCLIFWIFSIVFYQEKKVSVWMLHQLTPIGKISYSLYLLHIPVALLIKKVIFINNQPTEILVKYILWVVITFGLSFILDRIYQPAIKVFFDRNLNVA